MNKHISLVKKWLNDPDSVSQKELKDNAYDADAEAEAAAEASAEAGAAAKAAATADAAATSAHRRWGLSLARNTAAAVADAAAADADAAATARWVKRYEELIT